MNFNLKLKKIRTFRKMTQKELSEKIGLTDQHRIVQYEKGVRVPKKDLVDKMATALEVNPYTLYDTAGRDASEIRNMLTTQKKRNCFSGWMNLIHLPCICFFLGNFLVKNAMK